MRPGDGQGRLTARAPERSGEGGEIGARILADAPLPWQGDTRQFRGEMTDGGRNAMN